MSSQDWRAALESNRAAEEPSQDTSARGDGVDEGGPPLEMYAKKQKTGVKRVY
jgi:hypothetical protein